MQFLTNLVDRFFYNHEPEKVNYPLNDPVFNSDESLLDNSVLSESLYRLCLEPSMIKPMQFNMGVERALSRLVTPDVMSSLTGYSAYGFDKEGNFFADYWDGTADDFNRDLSAGITDFSKNRHQLFKIDVKGKLSACVVDEMGCRTKLILNTKGNRYVKEPKHSPSGLMFALCAYTIGKMEFGKIDTCDPGYNVSMIMHSHYKNLVDALNSGNTAKANDFLRALDNDLYTLCKFDDKVKDRYDTLPFISNLVDRNEYSILNDTEFDMTEVKGNSAYLSGSVYLSKESGFVNEDDIPNRRTIGEIIADDAAWKSRYVLDPDRLLTPDEELMVPNKNDMVPNRQILTKVELIKASSTLPRPFRNVLLVGETGSGKSTSVAHMAQLLHLPYTFLPINPDTMASDLLVNIFPKTKEDKQILEDFEKSLPDAASIVLDTASAYYQITGKVKEDATEADCMKAIRDRYYEILNSNDGFISVESPLVKAFRYGWVCEIQEANLAQKPGVLSGINAALDDLATLLLPDGEVVERHKDCVIVLTANVDYEGTRRLNQAVKSRCTLKGKLNLPDDSSLVEMIKLDSGYEDEPVIRRMIQAMHGIRKVLTENGVNDGSCGVREVVAWAQVTKILNDPYRAANQTIIPSATDDEEVEDEVIAALENYFIKNNSSSGGGMSFE